jgi:hypothetical protein
MPGHGARSYLKARLTAVWRPASSGLSAKATKG